MTALLLIDVGNTQTVVGVDDGTALQTWRLSTVSRRTADEYTLLLEPIVARSGAAVQGVALSSVVPAATGALRAAVGAMLGLDPVVVGPGVRTGMPLRVDNPREVGADRIVNALGAVEVFGAPVIPVDFGTATTVDLIGPGGEYRGGAIAPGLAIAADALVESTSALRHVDLVDPVRAAGRNTVEAIQSGLVFGYAGLVDGLLERIIAELGAETGPPIVATGGLAAVVVPHCRHPVSIDPDLTLRGLRVVWQRNRQP